jgi:hypothetical protein
LIREEENIQDDELLGWEAEGTQNWINESKDKLKDQPQYAYSLDLAGNYFQIKEGVDIDYTLLFSREI